MEQLCPKRTVSASVFLEEGQAALVKGRAVRQMLLAAESCEGDKEAEITAKYDLMVDVLVHQTANLENFAQMLCGPSAADRVSMLPEEEQASVVLVAEEIVQKICGIMVDVFEKLNCFECVLQVVFYGHEDEEDVESTEQHLLWVHGSLKTLLLFAPCNQSCRELKAHAKVLQKILEHVKTKKPDVEEIAALSGLFQDELAIGKEPLPLDAADSVVLPSDLEAALQKVKHCWSQEKLEIVIERFLKSLICDDKVKHLTQKTVGVLVDLKVSLPDLSHKYIAAMKAALAAKTASERIDRGNAPLLIESTQILSEHAITLAEMRALPCMMMWSAAVAKEWELGVKDLLPLTDITFLEDFEKNTWTYHSPHE